MENPHIVSLNNLCDTNNLLTGSNKKNILLVVDSSLANSDLEKVVEYFSNKAIVKYIDVMDIDKGMFKTNILTKILTNLFFFFL